MKDINSIYKHMASSMALGGNVKGYANGGPVNRVRGISSHLRQDPRWQDKHMGPGGLIPEAKKAFYEGLEFYGEAPGAIAGWWQDWRHGKGAGDEFRYDITRFDESQAEAQALITKNAKLAHTILTDQGFSSEEAVDMVREHFGSLDSVAAWVADPLAVGGVFSQGAKTGAKGVKAAVKAIKENPGIVDNLAADITGNAKAIVQGDLEFLRGRGDVAGAQSVGAKAVGGKGYADDGLGDSEIYRQSIPNLAERAEAAIRAGHSSPMIEKARGLGDVRPEMVAKVDYDQDWNFNPEVMENIRVYEREQGIKKAQEKAWLRTLSPAERKEYSRKKQERNLDYTPTEAEVRSSSKPYIAPEEFYDENYREAARRHYAEKADEEAARLLLKSKAKPDEIDDYEPWFPKRDDVDVTKDNLEGPANLKSLNLDNDWNWSEFEKIVDSKPLAEREKLMEAWRNRYNWIEGPRTEDLDHLLTENELFRIGSIDDPRKNPFSPIYIDPPSHPPNLEAIIKDTKPPKRIKNAEELHSAYDKVISKNPNITPEEFAELLEKNETSFGQGIFETFDVSDWDKGEATLRTKIDAPETQAKKAKKMIAQFIKLRNTPGAREAYLAKEAKKKANMATRRESGATGLLF